MRSSAELPFDRIIIYQPEKIDFVDQQELGRFLADRMGKKIELKKGFFEENYREGLEEEIAESRVRDKNERSFREPLEVEVEVEKKILEGERIIGNLYDGLKLSDLMLEIIPEEEKKDHIIALTERLIGTIGELEKRYHVRTVINSIPSIISTSGIVEGPAKPRGYYFEGEKALDFKPMEYKDDRMTDVLKSYALQTLFWRLTRDPFCEEEGCPLYNSHWQEEVIDYQLEGELCEKHEEILEQLI